MMYKNNVFLYRWDNRKGELIIEEGELSSHGQSWYGTVYIKKETTRGRQLIDHSHYEVSIREGIFYNNGLWLKERNDEKAKKLFIEEFTFKITKFQKEINRLNKRIEALNND